MNKQVRQNGQGRKKQREREKKRIDRWIDGDRRRG
jgi:hypothetical protein